MLKFTSWSDEIVLTWCKQEITCSWSFYPVLNLSENWIKGKKRFSSASGHMSLLEWRLRHNMRPYSSLSYNWDRICWLRERVDLLFNVSLTITFSNTVSSYPTSAFTWLSVLSWSFAFIFHSTSCYFCASLWRKLSVWISVRPRSLLQIMQSVRIFAFSRPLSLFFFFVSPLHVLLTYLLESGKSEKPRASITIERRSWLST